jgi:flagellar biosynthesis protein FlhF
MELKRIIARDSRSANEKAIQLYGPDVLIISSQRVDLQTELIVAVDVEAMSVAALAAADRAEANPVSAPTEARASAVEFVPFSAVFQDTQSPVHAPVRMPMDASVPLAPVLADAAQALMPEPDMVSAPAAVVLQGPRPAPTAEIVAQAAPVMQTQAASHEMQRSNEIVELLRQEMAALRKEFALSRQMMPWQDGLGLSPEIQKLSAAMMEAGMPAGLRTLVTDSIQSLHTVDEAWPVMHRLLTDALARPAQGTPEAGVHALCGPSGSGKTSMVGRLAYAAAQTHGADKQVMISFADQRPGAWAQMQLLAAQAGVECFRASDSAMLKALLDDLSGKTVWIDTSGTDFAAQAELLGQKYPEVRLHAVLPVDATVTSVQKILQNSVASWASLMLSKIDEAAFPWPLIKGLSDYALPVSCIAGHSRISVAPECFDASGLVGLALKPLQNLLTQGVPDMLVATKPKAPRAARTKAVVASDAVALASVKTRSKKAVKTDVVDLTAMAATRAAVKTPLKVVHG